jgi:hypothetical protein
VEGNKLKRTGLLQFQLFCSVVPVVNLLGQAILDCCLGLTDQFQLAPLYLCQMLRHDLGDSIALSLVLQFLVDPLALRSIEQAFDTRLPLLQWSVVQIGRIVNMVDIAARIHVDIEHALGDYPAAVITIEGGILDGAFEIEKHMRLDALIPLIHQYGAPLEEITVALQIELKFINTISPLPA